MKDIQFFNPQVTKSAKKIFKKFSWCPSCLGGSNFCITFADLLRTQRKFKNFSFLCDLCGFVVSFNFYPAHKN